MISQDDIDAMAEHDDAVTRCKERAERGTVRGRHIMPEEELSVIKSAWFWRETAAKLMLLEIQRGAEAMECSADPCRE